MNRVLTLIDRDTGAARSFVLSQFRIEEVEKILRENIAKEAYLLTDEAPMYKGMGENFTFHGRDSPQQRRICKQRNAVGPYEHG